jgi:hypothetical protein
MGMAGDNQFPLTTRRLWCWWDLVTVTYATHTWELATSTTAAYVRVVWR